MKAGIIAALAVLGLGLATPSVSAQTIKLGTLAPKGSPWYDILQDMTLAWSDASGGGVKARIYPGGAIGDETDMIRKMLIGQIQGAVLTSEGLARIVPELRVLQLPMRYRTDAEFDYVFSGMRADFEALFERRGYKVLNWGDIGWIRLFTKAPSPAPDDLQPLKLFCWTGDQNICEAWRKQNFTPVPLAFTDIFNGLQSGLIEAVFTAPVPALSYQWFGLATHMTAVRLFKMIGATVITRKVWQQIPEATRPAVAEAATEAGRLSDIRIRGFETESIKVMQNYGLTVHPLDPDLLRQWEQRSLAAYPVLLNELVPRVLVEKAERLLAEYRAKAGAN